MYQLNIFYIYKIPQPVEYLKWPTHGAKSYVQLFIIFFFVLTKSFMQFIYSIDYELITGCDLTNFTVIFLEIFINYV